MRVDELADGGVLILAEPDETKALYHLINISIDGAVEDVEMLVGDEPDFQIVHRTADVGLKLRDILYPIAYNRD